MDNRVFKALKEKEPLKMRTKDIKAKWNASSPEMLNRKKLYELFRECPIPENELLMNLALFIRRQNMSEIIFMNELYKKIINVHGIVAEFGVRWGRNLCLFESFRGMYEPFNHNRKIIGFDTFEGFPSISEKDGRASIISKGAYNVTGGYETYLDQVLECHEQESPISHIKKYQLVKGNAVLKIKEYLKENPETIIALAYFDFDIYEPTKACLDAIKEHLTKGSVIAFDQLNNHDYPGETLALKDVFGLNSYEITRNPLSPTQSYMVIK